MTLKDSRIVVLGGTSGIGLAVARAAISEGAEVVVGSSSTTRVSEAVAALGGNANGHAVDLSDEAATRAFFQRVGEFDHLAYTAGEPLQLLGLEADLADVRRFFELRYWGALAAAKYAHGSIRRGGSLVFTSGTAGARPQGPGWAAASSICAAMEGLTRALAVEVKPLRNGMENITPKMPPMTQTPNDCQNGKPVHQPTITKPGKTKITDDKVPAAEATVWTMLFSQIVAPGIARSTAIEITAAGMEVANVRPNLRPR